jgi:23S rRNA A2030 N6-methylase RlmJ
VKEDDLKNMKSELPKVMKRRGTLVNIDNMFDANKESTKIVEMDAKNVKLT